MKKLFFIVLLALGINCIYAVDYEWGKPITDYYPLHELKKSENIKSLQDAGQIYDILEKKEAVSGLQIPVYELYQNGRLSGFYYSLPIEKKKIIELCGVLLLQITIPKSEEVNNWTNIYHKKYAGWKTSKEMMLEAIKAGGLYINIPADTSDIIVKMFVYSENTIFTTIENYLDGEILYIYQPYNISNFIE